MVARSSQFSLLEAQGSRKEECRTLIIVEAALSFLGLGTQPPTPSWGWDLRANVVFIEDNP